MRHGDIASAAARGMAVPLFVGLAACGGGGGGSGVSLQISPSTVSATITTGQSYTFTETATVNGSLSGTVYVGIVDSGDSIQTPVSVQQQSATTYLATVSTVPSLSPGQHAGTIKVLLCADQACQQQYATASVSYSFNVANPAPALAAINARSAAAGCPDFSINTLGSNFLSSSQVSWNGAPLPTQYLSPTLLTARVPAAALAAPGTANVTVTTPAPGGGTTAALPFTIAATASATDYVQFQVDNGHSGVARTRCPVEMPVEALWTIPTGLLYPPVIAAGRVFALKPQGQLMAFDQSTGAVVWGPASVGPQSSQLGYDNGKLFVVSQQAQGPDPTIQSFDAASGAAGWSVTLPAVEYTGPNGPIPPPVPADGRVIVNVPDNPDRLYALSQASGATLWSQPTSTSLFAVPALTGSGIYLCSDSAFAPDTGTLLWSQGTAHGCRADVFNGNVMPPTAVGDKVYFPENAYGVLDMNGDIFDAATGTFVRKFPANLPPVVDGTYLYANYGGLVSKLRISDGTLIWNSDCQSASAPTLLVNDVLLIETYQGNICAADAATGAVLWNLNTMSSPVPSELVVGDGLLLVPSDGATKTTAYRLSAGG